MALDAQQLQAAAAEHAKFFDALVSLIPAKYYYDEEDRVDLKSMKKAERLAAKQQFKEQYKQNKKQRLDPDAPATVLDVQKLKAQQGQEEKEAGNEGQQQAATAGGAGHTLHLGGVDGKALSREELRERLHQKLAVIRQARNASEKREAAEKAKEWQTKKLADGKKQAQQKQGQQQQKPGQQGKAQQQQQAQAQKGGKRKPEDAPQQPQQQAAKKAKPTSGDAEESGFVFQKVELDDGRPGPKPKGAKKPSKEELLKAAEAKQKQMEALQATQEGKAIVQREKWQAALARASGEKVLDDPKLLRRSLKKEGKLKQKSAKAWQERQDKQQEKQQQKQNKRKENLSARTATKMDNRKEKRERKLMRPGFEGRKDSFIGGAGAAGGKGKSPAKP